MLYAYKAGLDLNRVLESVAPGAAGSWSLSNLAPRMIANNFDPGFFVEHFIKDMGIALSEANRMGIALPGMALAKQLYEALKAQGHGRDGTHALLLALASRPNRSWKFSALAPLASRLKAIGGTVHAGRESSGARKRGATCSRALYSLR